MLDAERRSEGYGPLSVFKNGITLGKGPEGKSASSSVLSPTKSFK